MASAIVAARAYANNEVAFIAWDIEKMIPGCLGFEVTRIYEDGKTRPLASWVAFRGQSNKDWDPQTTSVWPIQKLCWRDLTLRRRRDAMELRPRDVKVRYRIRPVGRASQERADVPVDPKAPKYEGEPIKLGYIDEGIETNWVTVTSSFGKIDVAFTNGILSGQWLGRALKADGDKLSAPVLRARMADPKNVTRRYLSGDVVDMLKELLAVKGTKAALYELADRELVDTIKANKANVEIVLSNSAKERNGTDWDVGNAPWRDELRKNDVTVTDRMFNNGHIGHNKFLVNLEEGRVVTGSTNWTPTGLCGQTNNAISIRNPDVAKAYFDYWTRLVEDTKSFAPPQPPSASTKNKQGPELRTKNGAKAACDVTLDDKTRVRAWFSPNTKQTTKKADLPPDLADVYSKIRRANEAVFFAVFLPSRSGRLSVIEEAIELGLKDPSVIVYGAISDPTAMPNYVPPPKKDDDDDDDSEPSATKKTPLPLLYDNENVHVVRATALTKEDVIADFEAELLKVGNAVIHDKIVVIDPLSPSCTVIVGSHNLGYKASYENDENLLVIEGNMPLAQAYAVHILDVYDHYRFRASQQEARRAGKEPWDGVLDTDDLWLKRYLKDQPGEGSTSSLVTYFAKKDE